MARCGLDYIEPWRYVCLALERGELAIIVVFGFLLFGPDKLPQMGRTIGRAIRQFRETQEKDDGRCSVRDYRSGKRGRVGPGQAQEGCRR